MKKILALILTAVMICTATACGGTPAGTNTTSTSEETKAGTDTVKDKTVNTDEEYEKPDYLYMGTAVVGGAYYALGLPICEILSEALEITATAQTTGGATENNTLIEEGELDFALTQASMAYACMQGTSPYESACTKVKGMVGPMTNGVFQVVTLSRTGITKMEDLKGKIVALGGAGGGTTNVANDVWSVLYGFTVEDIVPNYSNYSDAASALTDGTIDAVIFQSAVPVSGLQEIVAGAGGENVIFIGFTDEEIQKVCDTYPYYSKYDIDAEAYGTSNSASTICLNNIIVCSADLSDGLVYDMTKIIIEHMDEIQETVPATKAFKLENAPETVIPLHPGAERYYREKGLIK